MSEAFDKAAALLADKSSLTGPQARGVVRLGAKDAGLDVRDASPHQLSVVFDKLMPKRLEGQGLSSQQAAEVCALIVATLGTMTSSEISSAAASMFDRLDKARG